MEENKYHLNISVFVTGTTEYGGSTSMTETHNIVVKDFSQIGRVLKSFHELAVEIKGRLEKENS